MDIYNVWYDRWYYSPNPHLPHSYFLVNSGSQAHSNHGEREIEILDSENFENPNQSAANFIDKKKKKAQPGLELETLHTQLKGILLCLPCS